MEFYCSRFTLQASLGCLPVSSNVVAFVHCRLNEVQKKKYEHICVFFDWRQNGKITFSADIPKPHQLSLYGSCGYGLVMLDFEPHILILVNV